MKSPRKTAPFKRVLHLHLATSFLFFLFASAPHRVHHFFEQGALAPQGDVAHSNEQGESDHDHQRAPQGPGGDIDCAVQSVAQNAHAAAPPLIALAFEEFTCARTERPAVARAASFNPSPFSQRAPPHA